MLSVIMLKVVMLSVTMLSDVAPVCKFSSLLGLFVSYEEYEVL
jgi:hypothetical protein